MVVTKDKMEEFGKILGWDITEPYQLYTAPWSTGFILRDDTGFDDVAPIEGSIIHKGEVSVFSSDELPDGSMVEIYVDGYGHTLKLICKHPTIGS